MKAPACLVIGVACALIASSDAQAERNSRQRVAAFAKLPNWSGVWERFNMGPSDEPADPKDEPRYEATYKELLHPPYNAEWQAKRDAAVQERRQKHVLQARCRPLGFPGAMLFPSDMIQIIVTPEETTMLFYTGGARHIATDGRGHPPEEESFGTPWGDSVGHWEGDVLVVDTVSSNAPIPGVDGLPALGEQPHVVERIRALDRDTLEDQMTLSVPAAFAHPWELTLQYHRVPGMAHVLDSDCGENERNPVVDGQFTIAPAKN